MTDHQIEKLIDELIEERGITLWDMIGESHIDPEQLLNDTYGKHERTRQNKFISKSWSERFIELISEGEYKTFADFHNIKIAVPDLIRFWWNRCIDRQCMLDIIFEDIFCFFKDKMIPQPEVPEIDLSINTKQFILEGIRLNAVNQ